MPTVCRRKGYRMNHQSYVLKWFLQHKNPSRIKEKARKCKAFPDFIFVVGVTGLEPMASWSRTKRDTKLRHTPGYVVFGQLDYYILNLLKNQVFSLNLLQVIFIRYDRGCNICFLLLYLPVLYCKN